MFNFDFGDSWSSQNSQSPLLRLGTGMDPLVGLFPGLGKWKVKTGDKLQGWVSDNIAKKDPLIKHDRKNGLASWSKEARGISDWAQEKPLDATALVLGGVLGGGAAMGAWGGSGGGAAAGGLGSGGAAAAPSVAGFMPGSAAGGAAGLEGVTVIGSSGGAGLSGGSAAALTAAGVPGAAAAEPGGSGANKWSDWLDRMSQMQGQGGGQQQQAAPIQQPGQPNGARPTGTWDKVKAGLGRIGENMFPIDQAYGATPAQQQEMRRNALLQMGLGMMSASNQGAGFGEAAAFGLGNAQKSLTGALQRGYETARQNRQDQRQETREEIMDARDQRNYENTVEQQKIAQSNRESDRAYQTSQDQLAQGRWETERGDTNAYRDETLGLRRDEIAAERDRYGQGLTTQQRYLMTDRVRKEYSDKKQKVIDGSSQAEQILQLAAQPSIANDPSAQTALVMSFGKMLDPESVVREGEYKILEDSRGLLEQMQAVVPKLQTGSRLTPQQIQRMAQVATQFAGRGQERVKALDGYYNELSMKRGLDPFEVTGQSYKPGSDPNVIDVGGSLGGGGRGLGQRPQLGPVKQQRTIEVGW